jgi:serine/threonine-protein kinase
MPEGTIKMTKQCPGCGKPNRDDARFCSHCATPLVSEILCPSCGTANQPEARFCHYCATPFKGATPQTGMLQPNAVLAGRYIIVCKVGGGGMGAVYQAADQRLPGKPWAIKEMSDAAITNPLDKQQAVDAFRREAQLLSTLDHGNLPKVSDYFTEGGKHYLVMDFIQGRTLEEALHSISGFLDEDEVLD